MSETITDPHVQNKREPYRLPHMLWGLSATMVFPKVTRKATHYGIVWGPWFFGFVHGGRQQHRGNPTPQAKDQVIAAQSKEGNRI